MRIIGLTGGIGTGKSTVSSYLKSLGFDVIDADGIARELAGEPSVLAEIRDFFGDEVFDDDGSLDRRKMAEIVFSDVRKRELLESIITSRVIKKVSDIIDDYRAGRIAASKKDIVFLDAPTLFETGADRLVDEVWLVTCDMETRLERAELRDDTSREKIEARIASQMSEDDKAERSDEILLNNGKKEDLYKQIDKLIHRRKISNRLRL